jgi:hypothetical protein
MPDTVQINHLNLSGFELRNFKVEKVTSFPTATSGNNGQVLYNTTTGDIRFSNGSAWVWTATDSALLAGHTSAYHLDRANHTGSQVAATISDFNTAVRTNRLDQMTAPTASVSMGSQKITNGADGTASTDFVTKQQLDAVAASAASGVNIKAAVRAATTANITLSGAQTIDAVSVVAGDRVLVKNQTTAANNGLYVAASGSWTRSTDADTNGELAPGTLVYVTEGSVNGDKQFAIASDTAITIGTTAQTWSQISGSGTTYSAGNGLSLTSTTFSVLPATNGGLAVSGSGVALATTGSVRGVRANVSQVPAPSSGSVATVTHNLNSQDIAGVQLIRNSDNVGIGDVYWQSNGVNTVLVDVGDSTTPTDTYRAVVSAA